MSALSHLLSFLPALLLAAGTFPATSGDAASRHSTSPETRALGFLAQEVPRWSVENQCFSCHNNGDAARALYLGVKLGYPVASTALADTSTWLKRPAKWDENGGERAFNDKGLARIQFAAALRTAVEVGAIKERQPLIDAADSLLPYQRGTGFWQVGTDGTIGSPATYGSFLATYQARTTLEAAGAKRFQQPIERADRWLRQTPAKSVLDTAAVLLAVEGIPEASDALRQRSLALISRGQSKTGGWGPYVSSAPEPFDTAVVLLALWPSREQPKVRAMLRRGRAYLVATQLENGSWPATTRPAGADSYAQWISTSGWATLALLKTRELR